MAVDDDGFDEAFKGFGDDPATVTPEAPAKDTPPADPPKPTDEEPKNDPKPPAEPPKKDEGTPPAGDEGKPKEGDEPPKDPETPPAPETPEAPPQPLTKDDVKSVVSDLLNTERSSSKELENTTKEVLEKYYPDGLSNTLIDEKTQKPLRTPQDVVEAARANGGEMTTDEAAQWLLNEQFALDKKLSEIRDSAKQIAETTVNFKRDAVAAVQKYAPLFEKYPALQEKVYNKLMKQVKVDQEKGVILSSPDVMEHYDDYLEPYQQAFEFANNKPATNPVEPETPPKPTAEDRMDEGGDGGSTAPNDPNDFAQQVKKELAKGF